MSKYVSQTDKIHRIIRTTTLYSDGKTQVPKEVIAKLMLKRGATIVWVEKDLKIFVTNDTQNVDF